MIASDSPFYMNGTNDGLLGRQKFWAMTTLVVGSAMATL